jgi:hypothetical protein
MLVNPTLSWLARAADDPRLRHPDHLPETLDFREWAGPFESVYRSAAPGADLGMPIYLRAGSLIFPEELTMRTNYAPFHDGGRYVGSFHVHPSSQDGYSAPFFDPGDLGGALRSDNPGFMELLMARDRLLALVRCNLFLYISAHHLNRNPMFLEEPHTELIRRGGGREPGDPDYDETYRKAGLYYFYRYDLALYEGEPREALKRTVTPRMRG